MELTRRTALKTGVGALIVATTAGYATAQTDEGAATLELLAEENVDHQHACLHGDFDERTPLEAGEPDEGSPTVDDTHVIWEVAYEGDQRYVVFDADAHFADGPFVFYTADGSVTAIEGTELERGPVDDEYCDSLEEYVEIEPEDGRIALELVADLSEEDEPEDEDETDGEDEAGDEDEPDDEGEEEDETSDEDEEDDEDDADDEADDEDGDETDDEEDAEDGDDENDEDGDAEDGVDDEEDEDDEADDDPEDEDESEDEDEVLELSVSGPNEISTGESAQFHATVRNRGNASAEPAVTLEIGTATDSTTVDLDAGGCRAAWLCVDGADLPAGTHDWSVTSGSEVTTGTLTVTESSE